YQNSQCNVNFQQINTSVKTDLAYPNSYISTNITGFSAYLVGERIVVSINPDDPPTSPSKETSSGGGGGGITEEELAAALKPLKRDTLSVDTAEINKELYKGESLRGKLQLFNDQNETLNISILKSGPVAKYIKFDETRLKIEVGKEFEVFYEISVPETANSGFYNGEVILKSNKGEKIIPVTLRVFERTEELLSFTLTPLSQVLSPGRDLELNIKIDNPFDATIGVNYTVELIDENYNTILTQDKYVEVGPGGYVGDLTLNISDDMKLGVYTVRGIANYLLEEKEISMKDFDYITVREPFLQRTIYGLKVWLWLLMALVASGILLGIYGAEMYLESRKKYHIGMPDLHQLPKPGPRSGWVGNIAESKIRAFIDFEKLTTHTIVAGSTGGGKTIAAQVIVEEALKKNIGIIVFDPTAQWTGFLRKNEDDKMFSRYSEFGLSKSDAKGFNGNIHKVSDAKEIIDLKQYMKPGEIHIFTINTLNPKDIDIFVANTVSQIFLSNLEESPTLKTIVIYDEVHRLLSKFGGSGEGFIQVERACREFRKWGIGLMLISQVLSDFVGEIKANINTEVQVRTRDEGDLERIKTKYGEEILKAVVKQSVGTAMIENAEYNKGKPYLISFRPILHNVKRLSDAELDKYAKFNEVIEDLSYQIEQLEEAREDVFDLRLELNLALRNLKSGNFNMVNIYLDSLKPRMTRLWDKLGKKPKKKEKLMVSDEIIEAEVKKAEIARKQYLKEQKAQEKDSKTKKEDSKEEKETKKEEKEEKETDDEKPEDEQSSGTISSDEPEPEEDEAPKPKGAQPSVAVSADKPEPRPTGLINLRRIIKKKEPEEESKKEQEEKPKPKGPKTIEQKIMELEDEIDDLRLNISDMRKQGKDVKIAELKLKSLPALVKMARATQSKKDFQKVKTKLKEVKKELA
ncbi:DUF87 domain-containing protein, partial [Candidatus Woesearchaeota archaeon]|nr:DUF87 domain-containing protein [Candidatus Woesearchaeota archaeon]